MDYPRRYIKEADAAKKLDVAEGTLANWRWKGKGPPYYRMGNMVRYEVGELDRWVAAGKTEAA